MSTEWMDRGDCRNEDPELFFPDGKGRDFRQKITDAQAICAGCPVRRQCFDHGMATPWLTGIWGGATEHERKTRRHRARQQAVAA